MPARIRVHCNVKPRHGTGALRPGGESWKCAEFVPHNLAMESQYQFYVDALDPADANAMKQKPPYVDSFYPSAIHDQDRRWLHQQIHLKWTVVRNPPSPGKIEIMRWLIDELFELQITSGNSAKAIFVDNHGILFHCPAYAISSEVDATLQLCRAFSFAQGGLTPGPYVTGSFTGILEDITGSEIEQTTKNLAKKNEGFAKYHQDYTVFPIGTAYSWGYRTQRGTHCPCTGGGDVSKESDILKVKGLTVGFMSPVTAVPLLPFAPEPGAEPKPKAPMPR